ncbi:MAG: two-component sensor histidine kinase [Granulosicoccus sp.]|jgi:two-component sensor histidine kinase
MDIYQEKSNWKIYLAIMGILILTASLIYTTSVANKLAEEERKKVEIWVEAINNVYSEDEEDIQADFSFELKIIANNTTIPLILVEDSGVIQMSRNYGEKKEADDEFIEKRLAELKMNGYPPVSGGEGNLVYYEDSSTLKMLTYFPFIQLALIGAFVAFGYFSFSSARSSEQNQVWVGMAKETAHQLGTPITAIVAWIEHLRMIHEGNEETAEILDELNNDVSRLNLIADRFSKIGAIPELKKTNIYEELENMKNYMQRRAPRKMVFEFPGLEKEPLYAQLNAPLFNWVTENLMRNALDAMGGTGKISAKVTEEKGFIIIDISDTGKGIPSNKLKTVFKPGYSTKKRGWGLGLSLAKRIIESYHSGKIFVKKSQLEEGTTFSIKLPKS